MEIVELPEELRIFLIEAYENVDAMEAQLLALEQNMKEIAPVHDVFRGMHTIKGNAGFLGLSKLGTLCHRAESVLDQIRNGQLTVNSTIITSLLTAIDALRGALTTIENKGTDQTLSLDDVVASLENVQVNP